jgi:hypothetical protein
MQSPSLRAVGGEGASQPPMDRILHRLEMLENRLSEMTNILESANDRLYGGAAQATQAGGPANSAPRPRGPLLSEIDVTFDRLDGLSQRLSGEIGRASPTARRALAISRRSAVSGDPAV